MISTRPTLLLHPLYLSTAEIVKCFLLSKPLTPDQKNYLDWHQAQLSSVHFDPVLKYYLKKHSDNHNDLHTSFLLPHEKINRESIALLKKRIAILLQENRKRRIAMPLTHKQFLEFKECTLKDLIFWHGNQFLTGAPFYPSGIPPLIFFQWGNCFGIIKYVVIAGEKSVKGNLLLYFEDMQERMLDRCVLDYQRHMEEEIKVQNKLLHHQTIYYERPKHIQEPELTVSQSYLISHLPTPRP